MEKQITENLTQQEYVALLRGMCREVGLYADGGVLSSRNVLMELHKQAYRLTEFTNTLLAHLGDSA